MSITASTRMAVIAYARALSDAGFQAYENAPIVARNTKDAMECIHDAANIMLLLRAEASLQGLLRCVEQAHVAHSCRALREEAIDALTSEASR